MNPKNAIFTAALVAFSAAGAEATQQPDPIISISLTTAVYSQDFNSLANSPNNGTGSTIPLGWGFAETGTAANAAYTIGAGTTLTGDTFSFGTSGSADRAFGGLQDTSLVPTIGAIFTNNTGTTLTSLTITFTGEQWRLGADSRTDRLDFQINASASLGAGNLSAGTWTDVNALDLSSPVIVNGTSTGAGSYDGNASGNRTTITSTISGLNITNGASFGIRWTDFDATGADDGLAIDDFTIAAVPEPSTYLGAGLLAVFLSWRQLRRPRNLVRRFALRKQS